MAPLLVVDNITVAYGAIGAVRDLSFTAEEGEVIALLGANGAGKSSALKALSGWVMPQAGRITFDGADITRVSPENRVKLGLSHTPEGRRVFPSLSVAENLRLGAATRRAGAAERMSKLLGWFPVLEERLDQYAGQLSGGEQQQLAIARSLMSEPRLLLLDEPSLGLAPQVVDAIFDIIRTLREEGITILLVEQNVDRSLAVADRGYVLASGALMLQGSASELRSSQGVEAAYLGAGIVT